MKKSEVPQDESDLANANFRELCYATDEQGNYVTENSTGWEVKTAALTNAGGPWDLSVWSTTDFGADTKAIAIDVKTAEGAPIQPAGSFELNWKMKAPAPPGPRSPLSPCWFSLAWSWCR